MKLLIPTAISLLLLTACTSYKEGFDCEAVPGVGCKSIAQVDRMIDDGKLGGDDTADNPQEAYKKDNKELSQATAKGVHVWIAPYTDNDGITYGPQSLFVPFRTNEKGEM
ncbi:hypothetical protein IM40_07880 [Candidatus Paracaedimonas acanthamoebae]|nr:hypothetical protein IM40_07880 [Candidatus Paracaedimonas acanthamoebae]